MDFSIVLPVYNEEESIPKLIDEIHSALASHGYQYEIICIDDGSRDLSFELLSKMAKSDKRLVVGRLRRNFGQSPAMQAGFDLARGRAVIPMDADLQNDPADIPRMLQKLDEGYDMVAGWRAGRKDRFLNRRLPSMLANWIISRTTNVRLHDYGCTLKVIRREVAKELRLYGEMHRFIPALASLVGAKIYEMKVNHRARQFGTSKYGIGRTLRVILDLLTVLFLKSFLVRPMQVFGFSGLASFAAGFFVALYLSVQKIFFGAQLADRPLLLLAALLILVGVQLLSLGLVAEIVTRTYHESQGKSVYYLRDLIQPAIQSIDKASPSGLNQRTAVGEK